MKKKIISLLVPLCPVNQDTIPYQPHRDISQLLGFQAGVAKQAFYPWIPLLERLNNLRFVASNMREYYEVRLPRILERLRGDFLQIENDGSSDRLERGVRLTTFGKIRSKKPYFNGFFAEEILAMVQAAAQRIRILTNDIYNQLTPELAQHNIHLHRYAEVSSEPVAQRQISRLLELSIDPAFFQDLAIPANLDIPAFLAANGYLENGILTDKFKQEFIRIPYDIDMNENASLLLSWLSAHAPLQTRAILQALEQAFYWQNISCVTSDYFKNVEPCRLVISVRYKSLGLTKNLVIPIPRAMQRTIRLNMSAGSHDFTTAEEIIRNNLPVILAKNGIKLSEGAIIEHRVALIARDNNYPTADQDNLDSRKKIAAANLARQRNEVTMIEIEEGASPSIVDDLVSGFHFRQVPFRAGHPIFVPGWIDPEFLHEIRDQVNEPCLKHPAIDPIIPNFRSNIERIMQDELVLQWPYHAFMLDRIINEATDIFVNNRSCHSNATAQKLLTLLNNPVRLNQNHQIHQLAMLLRDYGFIDHSLRITARFFSHRDELGTMLTKYLATHPLQCEASDIITALHQSFSPDRYEVRQTLYRTNRQSGDMEALARAAEAGAYVQLMCENKARENEPANYQWYEALRKRGVDTRFSPTPNLKIHTKLTHISINLQGKEVLKSTDFTALQWTYLLNHDLICEYPDMPGIAYATKIFDPSRIPSLADPNCSEQIENGIILTSEHLRQLDLNPTQIQSLKNADIRTVITHVGTGNVDENRAKAFEDFIVLSSNPCIGMECLAQFNALGVRAFPASGEHMLYGHEIIGRLRSEIQHQIELARSGQPARIIIKANQLEEHEMIALLYEASRAGVKIHLIIRGFELLRTATLPPDVFTNALIPGFASCADNETILTQSESQALWHDLRDLGLIDDCWILGENYQAQRNDLYQTLIIRFDQPRALRLISLLDEAWRMRYWAENIRLTRVIDRHLEHSRVWIFGADPDPTVIIGSADVMRRNLHKRLEAMCVLKPSTAQEILCVIDIYQNNPAHQEILAANGKYYLIQPHQDGDTGVQYKIEHYHQEGERSGANQRR